MNTQEHKNTAAAMGLEWSIVRSIYAELRDMGTMSVARTLEARRIAYAAMGHKHGGTFKMANRHGCTIGDQTNIAGLDDVARELSNTEIPELGQDDPAAALYDLLTAPAPVLRSADDTMRAAIDRAAAELVPAAATAAPAADELLPLPAAAMVADITEQWLRKLVKAGRIPHQRIGRNYLVSRAAVEHFKRHPTMGRPRFAPF